MFPRAGVTSVSNFQFNTLCSKIGDPLDSNAPNSVCTLFISTKYCTLHYLNIIYHHAYYDVCILQCAWCSVIITSRVCLH